MDCDSSTVTIKTLRVAANDPPVNWARSDVLAGSTYDFGDANSLVAIQGTLTCSTTGNCRC